MPASMLPRLTLTERMFLRMATRKVSAPMPNSSPISSKNAVSSMISAAVTSRFSPTDPTHFSNRPTIGRLPIRSPSRASSITGPRRISDGVEAPMMLC
uniref:Uncharacterized protein n=1 Tax=uncultured marine virus TaxID=186617 RepID=A0A0F7L4H8_9VIRU|nr:hypothetical protein [uncultured marine virus]